MIKSVAEGLLKAVAGQAGITGFELDESGCCALSFDGIVVNFEADEDSLKLFLYADVGEAPAGLPEALYRRLLEANLLWRGTGGATLSLDTAAQRFVLAHGLPVDHTSEADFLATVETFVNIVEAWRKRIAEAAHEAPAAGNLEGSGPKHTHVFV